MSSSTTTNPPNHAAYLTAAASALSVHEAPMPAPSANQLTIRTHAVAFNPVDAMMSRTGAMLPSFPAILGCDAAGEVVALGAAAEAMGFRVGDRVAGCCDQASDRAGRGTFQAYCNVQAALAGKLPERVGWAEGSVLPLCLCTAAVGLFDKRTLGLPSPRLDPVDAGKTVLVWGGASSVGSCAIQMAKAAGLRVAATAGEKNLEYVKSMGADIVVDYRNKNAVNEIMEGLEGKGEFAGAFAAVMGREVYFACAEVCVALGGKQVVSTVLPEFMKFEEELPGKVEIAYSEWSLPDLWISGASVLT